MPAWGPCGVAIFILTLAKCTLFYITSVTLNGFEAFLRIKMIQELSLVVAFLLIACVIWLFIFKPKTMAKMPPCPEPMPVVGNLFAMLRWIKEKRLHLELLRLAKVYRGKLFTIKTPGQNFIVISSSSTAREAMLTKRNVYAGRNYAFTFDYLSRGSKDIAAQDFNPTLLLQRKIVLSAIRLYMPKLEDNVTKEADELVKRLIEHQEKPFDPSHELALTVMNVICAMVFGDRYELDDQEFLMLYGAFKVIYANIGLLNTLNVFPFLIHFPIRDSINLKEAVKKRDEFLEEKYHEHQRSYQEGKIRDLTDALIKALNEAEREDITAKTLITEDHVLMTIMDSFAAGLETTSLQIIWFVYFMARHPDIQAKVQEELDTVIGKDSSVGWKDKARLNYTFASIMEAERLSSMAPFLLPRKTTKDSTLEGYDIPKGTTVFMNVIAMHHDENEWKDPLAFKPERFLDDEGNLIPASSLKSFLPFGAGTRVCPGEGLAKQEMFIICSRLLQKFTIEAVVPTSQLPVYGEIIGANQIPVKFEVCFKQRL